MGVLDKFLEVLHLNPDDDEDYYDDDYDYDDDYSEEPVKPKKSARKEKKEEDYDDDYQEKGSYEKTKSTSKVTPIRPVRKSSSSGMEVCVIKPTSVEDAREITETLLNNRTVVLNVEGLDGDCTAHYRLHIRFLFCNQRKSPEDFQLHIYHYTGFRGHLGRFLKFNGQLRGERITD